jgi:hypothetical protein
MFVYRLIGAFGDADTSIILDVASMIDYRPDPSTLERLIKRSERRGFLSRGKHRLRRSNHANSGDFLAGFASPSRLMLATMAVVG